MDRGLDVQIDVSKKVDRLHMYEHSEGLDDGTCVGFAVGADERTGGGNNLDWAWMSKMELSFSRDQIPSIYVYVSDDGLDVGTDVGLDVGADD